MPWLRQLFALLSPRRTRFDPRQVCSDFRRKVGWESMSPNTSVFFCQCHSTNIPGSSSSPCYCYRNYRRSKPKNSLKSSSLSGSILWGTTSHFFVHHHSVFCPTTGPKPPPKRCLHIVRSRAFSSKWEYLRLSLRSSSSLLRLLPPLLATSISPFIFPSITCFRRQFLRKMWPIQLVFQ